jgi:AcrR family transcriptional regulator
MFYRAHMSSTSPVGGRPRDAALDERILAAAREQLVEHGYQGLSIGAVARAAGTTRPSVYLRFAGKEDLATAAIAGMSVADALQVSDDLHADLVAELRHFRTAVTRPNGMSFVGTVLAEEHHTPSLIRRFRERLVLPRRRRVVGTLRRGVNAGVLRPGLDVDVITTMLIGAIYARYLATGDVPADWPERVVASMWPAIGAEHSQDG